MTGKIFINYRRGDEPGFTHALLGRLEQAFPTGQLFIDVDNIPPGEDFVHVLDSQVARCDAFLAVIGKGWLDAKDESGSRRLDDTNDFVRIEIESALRQGKRVIPVLVHDARMPRPDELPETIRPLARRNAVRLTHERFRADVQGLVKALQGALEEVGVPRRYARGAIEPGERRRTSRVALLVVGLCGVAVAGSMGVWFANQPLTQVPQQTVAVQPAPVQPTPVRSTPVPPAPVRPTLVQPTPVQPTPVPTLPPPVQPTPAAAQPASSIEAPPPPTDNAARTAAKPDPAGLEVAFWNSIKDSKDPQLFEAYLKRYPNGTFVDIAKIDLEQLKVAVAKPVSAPPDAAVPISDPGLLREIHDRLYELNFDPGASDADGLKPAIIEFEAQSKLAKTGAATQGLLTRLRQISGLKPWGAIVYDKTAAKWGMAWDQASRKDAVASARSQCGTAQCEAEVSFFGATCGAFALSAASWSMASRDNIEDARQAALDGCSARGKACRVIGASCADGTNRTTSGN
jgi:hypothetical protein